jgi:glycosyltransferase involved in cell wall biosynthesis
MNAPLDNGRVPKVMHVTECAASGTLDVIVALTRALSGSGVRQLVMFSERAETPLEVRKLFPADVAFVQVPAASGLNVGFAIGLWRELVETVKNWQPDVVHLHSSKAGFVGRLALGMQPHRCKVLYSPHGLSFLDPGRPLRNAVFRILESLAAKTRAEPVGCSDSESKILAAMSGGTAALLENPVDQRFFAIERTRTKVPTIVSVGRLSRQKAPDRFALLAKEVRKQIPEARFIWIGNGDSRYEAQLLEAGCEVTGWIGTAEVAAFLASATVYVQTSLWEGLPVSVIQAQAAGVPCVVNDCAGNRDAVTDEVTGFVLSSIEAMGAAVLRLICDSSLHRELSANARTVAERRFGSSAFQQRVKQLYGLTAESSCSVLQGDAT